MKKVIFYISLIFAVIQLIVILDILINDLDRLLEYGYGYLVGKIILLIIFCAIALKTRQKKQYSN